VSVPDWQAHEYNDDFYILRESGCIHYEKPFLYLILGEQKALLEDTGAGEVQTAPFVMSLLQKWAEKKNRASPSLIVIHSHGHADHTAGDKQFQALTGVEFIATTPADVQKATGIATWPSSLGQIDLGSRILNVIPIPGHHAASIALYGRRTRNLLTGDSLYPGGRLYVNEADVPAYAASAQRLADFVRRCPVAHVLGAHIGAAAFPLCGLPQGHRLPVGGARPGAFLIARNRVKRHVSADARVPGVAGLHISVRSNPQR
jgi:glyoxylase-like metal-dependent hydrolase (beta-lactamase superfamily II)